MSKYTEAQIEEMERQIALHSPGLETTGLAVYSFIMFGAFIAGAYMISGLVEGLLNILTKIAH